MDRGGLIPCRRWRTQSLRLSSDSAVPEDLRREAEIDNVYDEGAVEQSSPDRCPVCNLPHQSTSFRVRPVFLHHSSA